MSEMRAEIYFDKNPCIPERRKHERCWQIVQSSLLHTSETWSWTKGLTDTLHGFESRCRGTIGTSKWKSGNVPLDIHRQTQIRRARRFAAHGGTWIEELVLKRIWNFGRADLGGNKQMTNWRLVHAARIYANAHWKQKRSTTARITTDLQNTLKMKRRRTLVEAHHN